MTKKEKENEERIRAAMEQLRQRKNLMGELVSTLENQGGVLHADFAALPVPITPVDVTQAEPSALARKVSRLYKRQRAKLRDSNFERWFKGTRVYRFLAGRGVIYRIATGRR